MAYLRFHSHIFNFYRYNKNVTRCHLTRYFHIQRTKDEKYERVWKSARGLWHNIQWREVFASSQNEWFDELPYGVAGQYYTLYPDKFWSGFSIHKRCYESPITNIPTFHRWL